MNGDPLTFFCFNAGNVFDRVRREKMSAGSVASMSEIEIVN